MCSPNLDFSYHSEILETESYSEIDVSRDRLVPTFCPSYLTVLTNVSQISQRDVDIYQSEILFLTEGLTIIYHS